MTGGTAALISTFVSCYLHCSLGML